MSSRTVFLILALLGPLSFVSISAQAATPVPVIDSFNVEPIETLTPGNDLIFTLTGTPGGKASVRISGVTRTINLEEVDPGEYEGEYTIRSRDKITAKSTIYATLKKKSRSSRRTPLDERLVVTSASTVAPATSTPSTSGPLSIELFTLTAVDAIEPGNDLNFKLTGTPRARASFTIEGVTSTMPMTETTAGSGVYEARYTIRRQDNFPPGVKITGTLVQGSETVSKRLDQPLVKDNDPPLIKNLAPQNNEVVSAQSRLFISGSFDDGAGSGVDPRTVQIKLDGRDITSQAVITPNFFSYQPSSSLPYGDHRVEVSAKDLAGQSVRTSWRFEVASSGVPTRLPLEITSPANNATISGSGPVEVRGRSAPNTDIDVRVNATASLAGLFGVNQNILDSTVRSDSQGYFSFNFQPRFAVPGTRYEVKLSASDGNQTREQTLVLFPQR